jgi:hypothetical protein
VPENQHQQGRLADDLARAAAAFLDAMDTGGAVVPLRDKHAGKYVVAGTLQMISKVAPAEQCRVATTLNWFSPATPPDDDTTVLLALSDVDVWPGYLDGRVWHSTDGMPLDAGRVIAWMHMPVGPGNGTPAELAAQAVEARGTLQEQMEEALANVLCEHTKLSEDGLDEWVPRILGLLPSAALPFEMVPSEGTDPAHYEPLTDNLDFEPDKHHQIADMANVGYALMQRLKASHPHYSWSTCPTEIVDDLSNEIDELKAEAPQARQAAAQAEVERLTALINMPETLDFIKGLQLETAHQRGRWATSHDGGKTPADWFWLIGYLAQKAMTFQLDGKINKALHHTITTAAALANWHAAILGKNDMRPGIAPPEGAAQAASTATPKEQNNG